MNFFNTVISIVLFHTVFAYEVGDFVSVVDQNREFDLCYGNDGSFKLADYNGDSNGGLYYVTIIDMSATWCGPCQSLIPLFDDLQSNYSNNEHVSLFVALSDLNEPYSCSQWGNMGTPSIPNIIDDSGYPIFNMFNTESSFPSLVLIDHEMKIYYKEAGYSTTFVNSTSLIIDEMLFNMYNSLILAGIADIVHSEDIDNDGIINPGDELTMNFTIENNSFNADAFEIYATVTTNDNIVITHGTDITVNNLLQGTATNFYSTIEIPEDIDLSIVNVTLQLNTTYQDGEGIIQDFNKEYIYSFDISLYQFGYPVMVTSQLKSTPVVIDFDDDGTQDIIIGDYDGFVRRFSADGIEITDDTFPFDTGNQIWGSPAAADIDNDGHVDVAVTSKSKSLYIFDHAGLKTEYDANSYLMGTPAIGQLDGDDDLEIVFGGFSSTGKKIYAINPDGSDVAGFPVDIGEKMFKGVALSDVNGNGFDDIAVGTDSNNILLILDDGSISWSYPTGDKVQSAASIINTGMQTVVCAGSKDDNMYCVDSLSGELAFMVETGGNVYTSPSAVDTGDGVAVFFGSDDGFLYAVDSQGNGLPGWPVETAGPIVGSIAYADLDDDGTPEIISTNGAGQMLAFHLDGSEVTYFPITASFPYSGSPHITDIDGDGDLEISAGTTGSLIATDFKSTGSSDGYWRTYRGSQARTGTYPVTGSIVTGCVTADVNEDDTVNVLDIVQTVNFAMGWIIPTDAQMCASDVNGDGIINVLDIVQMVNIVLGG